MTEQAKTNLRNSFWGGLDFFVTVGSVFLLIPVLLKTIGQEMFGIMVIVNTVMGLNGLASFGLGKATLKYVSEFRAKGETHLIREVIQATLIIYLLMGFISCLFGFIIAGWLAAEVFSVSPSQLEESVLAIKVGFIGFLGFLIFSVGENAWKGFERFETPVIVRGIARSLTLTGQIFLALGGFGILWLVSLQVGIFLIAAFIVIYLLKKNAVKDLGVFPFCSLKTIKRIFSYGFYTYLADILGIVRQKGDIIIVGAILGPKAVAIYIIPIRLLAQVHGLLARCFDFIFPYAGKLHSLGRVEDLKQSYVKATFLISILAAAMITPLGVFSYPIIELWLGREVALEAGIVMQIIALRFAVFPLSIVNNNFLLAASLVKIRTLIIGTNCVVSLSAITYGAYHWGLEGAAIGQLSVFLPVFINRYVIERKLFAKANITSVFIVPIVVISPIIVFFNLGIPHADAAILQLILKMILTSGFAGLGTLLVLGLLVVSNNDSNKYLQKFDPQS